MRCILCDRCKKIVEDERKIKVVTYARPLGIVPRDKCLVARADDRQFNDVIWTMELCPACAEELENFMVPDENNEPSQPIQPEEPGDGADTGDTSGGDGEATA